MYYRIGEFSKIVKLTVKTLRFYDEIELLKPSHTDKFTGYRYYSVEQLFSLQQIVVLREAGFSIEEIKSVLSGRNVTDLLERKETELTLEIWRTGDTLYYKSGVTDPDYCVLKFTAEKCRRYCNLKSEWVNIAFGD